MKFGQILKGFRKKNGLNLAELSAKTGIAYQMISRYESGKSAPTIDTVHKIAEGLNISISELLGETSAHPDTLIGHEELIRLQAKLIEVLEENRELRKYLEQNQK